MSRVALIGENSIEYVEKLIDIWNRGDCAVLLDWRIPFETLYHMMVEANVHKCFIESRLIENRVLSEYSEISFISFEIADRSPRFIPDRIRKKYQVNASSDEAVILYSSGTTGKSKGIILSHYAITTNASAILGYMELNHNDCIYIVKPLSHSSTLTGELLVSLYSGVNAVLSPSIVIPRHVLGFIKEFTVTTLCINPTLLRLFSKESTKGYDLCSLKTIYCSGSILSNKEYADAKQRFDNIDIFNVYGLTEAGPRVTAHTKECRNNNSVGKALNGIELSIVNDSGKPLEGCERGIIHVNTPSRYSGYVIGTEKHKSLYRNWLNTGDIGYIDEFGELNITGRVDDIINIDSHKVYPCDIERLIIENTEVFDCLIGKYSCEGKSCICCVYVSNVDCALEILHTLKNCLLEYEVPKKVIRTNVIPRNNQGKIDRNIIVSFFK